MKQRTATSRSMVVIGDKPVESPCQLSAGHDGPHHTDYFKAGNLTISDSDWTITAP